MIKVRVKGEGVKLANKWCYINDEAIIDEEEYERNKEYVDIIKDDEELQLPPVPNNMDNPDQKEIAELREKAKELGIRNYHLMGKDKLEVAIAEKTAPLFGVKQNENPEGTNTNSDGTDTNIDSNNEGDATGENNPQE